MKIQAVLIDGFKNLSDVKITFDNIQEAAEKSSTLNLALRDGTISATGFAKAMEIDEDVTSPTFNIIKEYTSGEMPLYHMDVYRLDGKMTGFDIEEYYTKKGVTIIEWADMIPDYLPEKRLDIRIRNSEEDENKRIITLIPHGKKYEELCEAVL